MATLGSLEGWYFELDSLKNLKDSNPNKTTEYVVANGISVQLASAWWVKSMLSNSWCILSKLGKTKYFRTTEKFEIKVPRTVAEATCFINENSNTLWTDTIRKEMTHVLPVFK